MVLMQIASSYSTSLLVAPLSTKAITAAAVAVAGDALAQSADASIQQYNVIRGQGFALFGASYTGVFQHHLFGWLDALTPCGLRGAIECTAINQFLVIPLCYMPLFLLMSGMFAGRTIQQTLTDAHAKFWPLVKRNWSFWLPVQCALFALAPQHLLVPLMCLCSVAWNYILSMAALSAPVPVPVPVVVEMTAA